MKSYAERKGRSGKRSKLKKSINDSTFTALRHDVINSPSFLGLSNSAKVAFLHLLAKYNRKNNGDLSAPQSRSKQEFNLSAPSLRTGLKELEQNGFIETTRQGGKNQCSLYALTCFPLNDVNKAGIFIKATERPSDKWKKSF
ncbi:hypothetical protein HMPREF9996_01760 [Aggregatibacter actinomycetemcomitans Y4]|uniref:winged helix-turn-helix domain-containing protein n=1 Tax=Aggregatibacter actinomycetemcomitans TaxID=714 RepID=UPI0002A434B9|nr:winged helix-turn-helix domain-containing protein [Aggregatibacter actinomycetemcomitans]EKX94661.1 hypothetical protein HMPREF9996_01760 [Aggregatibacter actinomycetemcomitans Y4]TYA40393.1 winged helix-turn-helix transcriptional regulator [Aggregatibacter actinomycetemcomitans]TYA44470.1 winged helix-turn-helix transcriptional regulator [Aggregatibacter actinomycetemcomitans]